MYSLTTAPPGLPSIREKMRARCGSGATTPRSASIAALTFQCARFPRSLALDDLPAKWSHFTEIHEEHYRKVCG